MTLRLPYSSVLLFLLLGAASPLLAQDSLDTDSEQKIENIAETQNNEDLDYTSLLEQLDFFRQHPIDLNNTDRSELLELGLLSETQVNNLLAHISRNGRLLTVIELQSVEGFDAQTIKKILPYVTVTERLDVPHLTLREMIRLGQHSITLRASQVLEPEKGFAVTDTNQLNSSPNAHYIGSPQKLYARYRFNYGTNISWGVTGEKDEGELFLPQNQPHSHYYDSLVGGKVKGGFDFYSAHFFLRNIKFIKALAIGDFSAGFGQGLVTWLGLAYGKSGDAMAIKKNGIGLRPYTSVDENRFFRGAGVTVGHQGWQLTGFFSKKKIDANIVAIDTLNNEVLSVSSLQLTGLHTTPSELADKHAIDETVFGGNISYNKRKVHVGMTGVSTSYSADYSRSLDLYNKFEFSSDRLTSLSTDYSFLLRNFNFFGEAATSITPGQENSGGLAFVNGVLVAPDRHVSVSVLHRYYQKNYRSVYANAFAEGTLPANEQGLYLGLTVKPTDYISFNAFFDHFTFPWLRYQVDAPSHGTDWLVQLNYTPSKKLDMYLRVRQRDKFANFNVPDDLDYIIPTQQVNYRYNITYVVSPLLRLRNRIEYLQLDNGSGTKENGYLIYQDVILKLKRHLTFTARYALFDTDSYNSRLYAYENDVPGAYSIPSYYYRGSRAYLMVNYDITRKIELWLRYGQTFYSNQQVISAGSLTEIDGSTKSTLRAQLRIRF